MHVACTNKVQHRHSLDCTKDIGLPANALNRFKLQYCGLKLVGNCAASTRTAAQPYRIMPYQAGWWWPTNSSHRNGSPKGHQIPHKIQRGDSGAGCYV